VEAVMEGDHLAGTHSVGVVGIQTRIFLRPLPTTTDVLTRVLSAGIPFARKRSARAHGDGGRR
jgi:hypothetical protein